MEDKKIPRVKVLRVSGDATVSGMNMRVAVVGYDSTTNPLDEMGTLVPMDGMSCFDPDQVATALTVFCAMTDEEVQHFLARAKGGPSPTLTRVSPQPIYHTTDARLGTYKNQLDKEVA